MECPLLGWLMRQRPDEVRGPPTIGERFRMEQGLEIGRRARQLYPVGTLVEGREMGPALDVTERLMKDPGPPVLFESAFLARRLAARVDILIRDGGGWHLIEVKSGVNDKQDYVDDMAYTALVFILCGHHITKASLMLVSKDFRLGMDPAALFQEIDHTSDVMERMEDFKDTYQEVERTTGAPEPPPAALKYECGKCPLFDQCTGRDIEHHIFEIPRLGRKKFNALCAAGITGIRGIPNDFDLTDKQARVRDCAGSGRTYVGPGLAPALERIRWPAYYLDFETTQTAIPLYPDLAPYTNIVTQYSIHRCDEPGNVTQNHEFLADPEKDDRRALALCLIRDLGERGSIIAYSGFEKTVIKKLAEKFPDLEEQLLSLVERLVDLEKIIRNNFCHPGFHGSTSIKRTLPALVPEMSYDGMSISNGDEAMAIFADLARGKIKGEEAEETKKHLLEYCRQDTLAMVKLHERLLDYV